MDEPIIIKTKQTKQCNINNCRNEYYARGYCKSHYAKLRYTGKLQKLPPYQKAICKKKDCKELHSAKGFCEKHYREFKVANNPMVYKNVEIKRQKRHRIHKLKLIDILGGKCKLCGYNKNPACLEFHHIDASTKLYTPKSIIRNPNFEVALEEIKKCVLLCKNCHTDLHHPIKVDLGAKSAIDPANKKETLTAP